MQTKLKRIPIDQKILSFISLIILVQFYLYWKHLAQFSDSKLSLEEEVYSLQAKKDKLIQEIATLERNHYRMELQYKNLALNPLQNLKFGRRKIGERIMIFMITPTHRRPSQKADLVRLSQTLLAIPDLYWIVVEDSNRPSKFIGELLKQKGFMRFVHLSVPTPFKYRRNETQPDWKYPKGINQRNLGLEWLRTNFASFKRGVVYFGDDDNTYDWRLFDEMRTIQRIGVWPVGLVGEMIAESPLISSSNLSVYAFNSVWKRKRSFPMDMASFALNITLILKNKQAKFTYEIPRGDQESYFLKTFNFTWADLEPKADFCSKVYVWHTKTAKPILIGEQRKIYATGKEMSPIMSESIQ